LSKGLADRSEDEIPHMIAGDAPSVGREVLGR